MGRSGDDPPPYPAAGDRRFGLDAADAPRLEEALQAELGRLLAADGASWSPSAIPTLHAPAFEAPARPTAAGLGRRSLRTARGSEAMSGRQERVPVASGPRRTPDAMGQQPRPGPGLRAAGSVRAVIGPQGLARFGFETPPTAAGEMDAPARASVHDRGSRWSGRRHDRLFHFSPLIRARWWR